MRQEVLVIVPRTHRTCSSSPKTMLRVSLPLQGHFLQPIIPWTTCKHKHASPCCLGLALAGCGLPTTPSSTSSYTITGAWAQPSNWTYYFPDSPVTGSGHTTPFGPRPEQKPCAQLLGCASQGSGPLLSSPKPEAVGGGAVLASYLP